MKNFPILPAAHKPAPAHELAPARVVVGLLCACLVSLASPTAVPAQQVADSAADTQLVDKTVIADKTVTAAETAAPDALNRYVQMDDGAFQWELLSQQPLADGKVWDVKLTSQKWHDIVWEHSLQIFEPSEIQYPGHVLLFVSGGRNGSAPKMTDQLQGLALAKYCGARVAVIRQVPNQPLLGDHVEDDLITETWLKYLETGDETWPLLFPMVKSAVKAMDAVQAVADQHWEMPVHSFVITGASKRGWTSWLTPVVDNRVVATAPIVIDVLNFRAQMKHQKETWGEFSEQIADYFSKGLIVEGEESDREKRLRLMMDPYGYRDQLQLPKLLVNGTNDPYWVVDAMKWYWDDLQGPKYILQVPNAGHGLEGGIEYALSTVSAFFQHVASETPLPQLEWKHGLDPGNDKVAFELICSEKPLAVFLWSANSADKDFRDERWTSIELAVDNELAQSEGSESFIYRLNIAKPESGYIAHYMEARYEINGVKYSLCTQVFRE